MACLTRRAQKDLEELPDAMKTKVLAVVARLDAAPSSGWKLKGKLQGTRSINVGRSHRILYSVTERGVIVKTIRPRRDVYR